MATTVKVNRFKRQAARKQKWHQLNKACLLALMFAQLLQSPRAQLIGVAQDLQKYYYQTKKIDAAGEIQLSYGASNIGGSSETVEQDCFEPYGMPYIVDKETNILVDEAQQIYFLQLVPSGKSGGQGNTCTSMDPIRDYASLTNDGPMSLQAEYQYNHVGYYGLVGINFFTEAISPLGRQSTCASTQVDYKTLTTGELEIGSAIWKDKASEFSFIDANQGPENNCNHLWKISYSSNVILLGTNGAQNSEDTSADFDTFGVYYRILTPPDDPDPDPIPDPNSMIFSGTTPQQITINTRTDDIEHPMLDLLLGPAEPSLTPSFSIEPADAETTLRFGGYANTDISIDFLANSIKIPDLNFHLFTKTYTFNIKAIDTTRDQISAEYQLIIIVAGGNFNFRISHQTVKKIAGSTDSIEKQQLAVSAPNSSDYVMEYKLTGDTNFGGLISTHIAFNTEDQIILPPESITLPINSQTTVIVTGTNTIDPFQSAIYELTIRILPSSCSTAVLSTVSGHSEADVIKSEVYESQLVQLKWVWSMPVSDCNLSFRCSSSADLCQTSSDITISHAENIEVDGSFQDSVEWALQISDMVARPPGEYTMTITVGVTDNPATEMQQTLALTLIDQCDFKIVVDTIPDQVYYINDLTTLQVQTSGPLPSCTIQKEYTLTQDSFFSSWWFQDGSWISIDTNGLIKMETQNKRLRSSRYYQQIVTVVLPGYEAHEGQTTFFVQIKSCISLSANSEKLITGLEYILGTGEFELAYVLKERSDCFSSYFTVTPSLTKLGVAFNTTIVDEDQGWISLKVFASKTSQLAAGNHTIIIDEVDWRSGHKASTTIEFKAIEPFAGFNVSDIDQKELNVDDEKIAGPNDDFDQASGDQEGTLSKPEIYIDESGQVIYPWQKKVKTQTRERQQIKIAEYDEIIVPLQAQVLSLSPTGNLTIGFNKPIILPPIRVDDAMEQQKSSNTTRILQADVVSPQYEIKDIIELEVESSFHEQESESIRITNYNLTRMTNTRIDIQIEFAKPEMMTQSANDPDEIQIRFRQSGMFMDQIDYMRLDPELEMLFMIQPQKTLGEIQFLEKLGDDVESGMTTLSIVIIGLQFFLAMGLKYLWNIMNLLQFLIFMQTWLILLPSTTSVVLKQLRVLALGEFIPTEFFKSFLKSLLGMNSDETDDDDDACQFKACDLSLETGGEKSIAEEETDIERVGKNDLIENMGTMLLIATGIVFGILILFLLWFIVKRYSCANKAYVSLKKKLFYNTFLRYVLQSTLKLQMAACTVISYNRLAYGETQKETKTGSLVFAWFTLAVLNLCPFLFFLIVKRNQTNLDKPEIKQKIGTLYTGLRTNFLSTKSYYFVFLLRRTLFIAITFSLFRLPGIQGQLMIYMTLLYIIYLGHSEFFEHHSSKSIEMLNESVFVLIQYGFVLLTNLVWDLTVRKWIGDVIVGLTAMLLLVNMAVIIAVSVKALCWSMHLKKLKKRQQEIIKEREEEREVKRRQELVRKKIEEEVKKEESKQVVVNKSSSESKSCSQSSSSYSKQGSSSELSEINSEISKHYNIELVAQMEDHGLVPAKTSFQYQPREERKFEQIELKLKASSMFQNVNIVSRNNNGEMSTTQDLGLSAQKLSAVNQGFTMNQKSRNDRPTLLQSSQGQINNDNFSRNVLKANAPISRQGSFLNKFRESTPPQPSSFTQGQVTYGNSTYDFQRLLRNNQPVPPTQSFKDLEARRNLLQGRVNTQNVPIRLFSNFKSRVE